MASHENFISQFRTGGDPCTYKESGELQTEIGKLTHPARPDVDWHRVENLSLALFRQNGVELQTLVCYALARTKRQGLTGMEEGLSSLEALISQRWGDFWPVQVHSRVTLLSWITERMQQALRALDIQYQDLALVYRCEQYLTAMENVLRQCELWHMTKLDAFAGQLRNTALRLERLAPQGAETTVTNKGAHQKEAREPENTEKSPAPVFPASPAAQTDKDKKPPAQIAGYPRQRTWPIFIAGMVAMACLGGAGLWGWSQLNQPDELAHRLQISVMPLPVPLDTGELAKLDAGGKAILNQDKIIEASRAQLEQLDKQPPRWVLELGYSQLRQLNALWPHNPQVQVLEEQWRKQRELNALPSDELRNYMQAQEQLQRLSTKLDELDERKGRYLTGSELKSAVFGIRQSLQVPPLEELLRQLEEQKQAGDVSPTLLMQIDTRMNQLLNRYVILLNEKTGHRESTNSDSR
ncbi:type VI secretion system protein VasL [Salmonella enterica]|nr:type VI secretion system protein VasL [Salmonella enterica]EBK3282576.1 type VI secretion system protein VasL [Salmonella enterica]